MKISIITRHAVPNYGSLLQSYATQKIFEKIGFDVEFINYVRYDERATELVDTLVKGKKWNKNIITRNIYKSIQYFNYKKQVDTFNKYRYGFINETKEIYGNCDEIAKKIPEADIYCSGGDQIWGPIGNEIYDKTYFLDFLNNVNDKTCIAFSSSFGTEKIEKKLEQNLSTLLNKYKYMFVREKSAESIIKKNGFENVSEILDPTILLNSNEWNKIISNDIKEKDYILVYQLHSNKEFDKYANKVSKIVKKPLIRISPSIFHIVRSGKFKYLPNQYEFLAYFKNADLVLTDSFHGTVFSLIFNKQFVCINPGKTQTRIKNILRLTNLEDRILESFSSFGLINKTIDYDKVNPILENKRRNDLINLKSVLLKASKENNISLIGIKNNCTGCRLCEKVCPKKAIDFKEDNEGFVKPFIDKDKCVNCGLCIKKCPQHNDIQFNEIKYVYAAKNNNLNELMMGSSGSVFKTLANYYIECNGIIYGTAFDNNLVAKTTRVDNFEDLFKLMGSKYVQGNTENTYIEVLDDLKNGKKVLYVGTPCQIAGLKSFLSNKDTTNLLLVDIICHGVPSPKLFKKYKEYIEYKTNKKIKSFNFRSKEKNGWGMNTKIEFEDGSTYHNFNNNNAYFSSFLKGKTYRLVCYNCKYAQEKRVGDITLGDFWGIRKEHPSFKGEDGASIVMINTKKGEELIKNIESNITMEISSFKKAANENSQLLHPSKMPQERLHIYDNICSKSFEKYSIDDLKFKKSIKENIKGLIPRNIKKKLKKIKRYLNK